MDLADIAGGPKALAAAVHRQLGAQGGAVPIVEVARALDIVEVNMTETDGFEGLLLTDAVRSRGGIIANTSRGRPRARFTVAHELGHFLIERHVPSVAAGFQCRFADMRERGIADRHQRQEAEANRFAIEMLAPPRLVGAWLRGEPDIGAAVEMGRGLEISMEAALRRYVELHDEALAAIWSKDGRIRYASEHERFPFLTRRRGDSLSASTAAFRVISAGQPGRTTMTETVAAAWLQDPDVELFEQTRVGKDGHAATLLWTPAPEEDSEEEDAVHRPLSAPGFPGRN